jgi:hypothetical protein
MKLPNLSGKKKNPKSMSQLTNKEELRELIYKHHGIITLVCCELDCSFTQFYRAVHKWELDDDLKKAKEAFVSAAEATLYEALSSKSEGTRLKAADTILKYNIPRQSQEITVKTGDVETTVKQIFGLD